ncbi:serine/threonine-protein kinase EDR1-like [Hibiscus syriacus]|uniref:serine/threonine-protein kinase EDR1-like n=1 Tax=Hibiscus syriacus TaxID=106335 RepID=UPI0019247BCF|nr:serine/threonine-protein kinase EDR1-like [Hibiscus syriacus]
MKSNGGDQYPAGGIEKTKQLKENGLRENQNPSLNTASGRDCFVKEMPVETAEGSTMNSRLHEDKLAKEQTLRKEIGVSGSTDVNSEKQLKDNMPCQSDLEEIGAVLDNQGIFSTISVPRYLHLEPSLAIDWLEISWDELHIKERVGAGSFGTVHRAEWHGLDVAVKVLTDQDLHDDQLKQFLRGLYG